MRFLNLFFCTGVLAVAVPSSHVVDDERIELDEWVKQARIDPNETLSFRVALTQQNLENGEDFLLDVSHPSSPNYGKHWSFEEVVKKFQPTSDTVFAARKWLESSGIALSRIHQSDNKAWLGFDAKTHEVEKLLYTQMFSFKHTESHEEMIACDKYYIPKHIKGHVDYVVPGVILYTLGTKAGHLSPQVASDESLDASSFIEASSWETGRSLQKQDVQITEDCAYLVTPACVSHLYGIPLHPKDPISTSNKLGIYNDYSGFNQEGLDRYFHPFASFVPNGTHPLVDQINGFPARTSLENFTNLEFALDYEVSQPIIYPQKSIAFYQNFNGHTDQGQTLFTPLFDAIEPSFCKSYKVNHVKCGIYKAPNVISISFGTSESLVNELYQKRQCHDFMKLALQGTSLFFSSGDSGVSDSCKHGNQHKFESQYPNGCYAITSVGGTQIPPRFDPAQPEVLYRQGKSTVYTSGGGFSQIWPRPKYQQNALNEYFSKHKPPLKSYMHFGLKGIKQQKGFYNRAGRGYPDVAAIGRNVPIYAHRYRRVSGTSASTPIFAAIITRINEERIRAGKPPVGFVNPVLYEHPEVLVDITKGNNSNCDNKNGFNAVKGWDPTTGLGSPNYGKMLKLFMSLP